MPPRVEREPESATLRLLDARLADPAPLLAAMGEIMVARTEKGFRDQRRGRFAWRERAVPNVAGAVRDLNAGRAPVRRRFDPRPVLHDEGTLRGSIASRPVGKDGVEFGTNRHYASLHQFGGESEVVVTQAARDLLAKLLRAGRRRVRRAGAAAEPRPVAPELLSLLRSARERAARERRGGGRLSRPVADLLAHAERQVAEARQPRAAGARRDEALAKLGFLFARPQGGDYLFARLEIKVPARPFVVVADQDVRDLNRMVVSFLFRGRP